MATEQTKSKAFDMAFILTKEYAGGGNCKHYLPEILKETYETILELLDKVEKPES